MSEHAISLSWARRTATFEYEVYNRSHEVTFKNGEAVNFSAAAAFRGNPACIDPEEAFVASLASCHMLTFLAVASRRGFVIDSYRDEAVGFLEKNELRKLAITRVELRPQVRCSGERQPDSSEIHQMHEKAHEECFIANSVRTEVRVLHE